jgi:hypothetical protein
MRRARSILAASRSIGAATLALCVCSAARETMWLMDTNQDLLCSVTNCPLRAVSSESGTVGDWIIEVFYCEEHANEKAHGTPLGAVGLDSCRLRVTAVQDAMPEPGGRLPGID